MNRTLFSIATAVFFSLIFSGCSGTKTDKLITWNIYKGQIEQYHVEIEDAAHESYKGLQRIVHLRPTDANEIWGSEAVFYSCGITGHDYDGDGSWDRVFYCGYPEQDNGCNSVHLQNGMVTAWEPCPADEGQLRQFTDEAIVYALSKLNEAMFQIHNSNHLTSTLKTWNKQHEEGGGKNS